MMDLGDFDVFVSAPFGSLRNVGYYKQKNGWTWESKCDYACFYCITEGSLTLTLEGNAHQAVRGDVVFLRAKDAGATMRAGEAGVSYYFLSCYFVEGVSLGISPLVKDAAAISLFKDEERAYHSEAYLYKLKSTQIFLEIVHRLATVTAMKSKAYSGSAQLRAAIEYININYYKRITVAGLCAVSNYSPAHLRRLFLKHYGVTPQEYILQKKLSIARGMLLDAPDKNVDEIAEQLSFCSASYLCKLFKKHYGLSTVQYKRLNANKMRQADP
jgi:AraC-like DNA-binding protein